MVYFPEEAEQARVSSHITGLSLDVLPAWPPLSKSLCFKVTVLALPRSELLPKGWKWREEKRSFSLKTLPSGKEHMLRLSFHWLQFSHVATLARKAGKCSLTSTTLRPTNIWNSYCWRRHRERWLKYSWYHQSHHLLYENFLGTFIFKSLYKIR